MNVCRLLARHSKQLYGTDALSASLVDMWLDYAREKLTPKAMSDYKSLSVLIQELTRHLKLRSFFVGYEVTLADLVIWTSLRQSNIWVKISKTPVKVGDTSAPVELVRWYNFMSALPATQEAYELAHANKSTGGAAAKKADQGSFDIDLAGAEKGKVVTRFPPEPSGYLHIGHAKAALLNEYFAHSYDGTLIVRFDDTNPSKEKAEFEESILHDLEMLKIKGDKVTWTSDHFDTLYNYALKMIKEGKAYVDDTQQEQMRDERMKGIASKCRDQSVDENLRRFEEMKKATEFGLTCCLRAKMSVDAKNKAMRDPVIYRCNVLPHNRTGDKWKIYPTYDFACPVVDSIEGVTHALRTNEYHDRNDQYYWFIDSLGLRKPHIWDYSRVNFVYTLLSKRKLQWFVDQKLVSGWDDPRFPTVRGILRRGMTVEALKKYILMQGASKNTLLLEWDKLWTLNKQIIDPVAPRYCALNKANLCTVRVLDGPEKPIEKSVPKHKKNPDLGNKMATFTKTCFLDAEDAKTIGDNEEVTLMDWGNFIVGKIVKNTDGSVTSIEGKLNPNGDFRKTKKFTWLPDIPSLVPVQVVDFDYLITKKKLEEGDLFEDCVNPATEFVTEAVGDANLKDLKKGEIIQLERRGYFICDQAYGGPNVPVKLLSIPDGRAQSISLKNTSGTETPDSKKAGK